MELYDMLKNIRGVNVITEIEKSICHVRNELNHLTKNQTCMIYSGHLLKEMKNNHLQVRLISTLDLNFLFEHYFLLVSDVDTYFVVGLTYEQFNASCFTNLKEKGYMEVNDLVLNQYLSLIGGKEVNGFTCDDLFFMEIDKNVRK